MNTKLLLAGGTAIVTAFTALPEARASSDNPINLAQASETTKSDETSQARSQTEDNASASTSAPGNQIKKDENAKHSDYPCNPCAAKACNPCAVAPYNPCAAK